MWFPPNYWFLDFRFLDFYLGFFWAFFSLFCCILLCIFFVLICVFCVIFSLFCCLFLVDGTFRHDTVYAHRRGNAQIAGRRKPFDKLKTDHQFLGSSDNLWQIRCVNETIGTYRLFRGKCICPASIGNPGRRIYIFFSLLRAGTGPSHGRNFVGSFVIFNTDEAYKLLVNHCIYRGKMDPGSNFYLDF